MFHSQKAAEVVRAMLRLSETRTVPTSPESVHLSFTEVESQMKVPEIILYTEPLGIFIYSLEKDCNKEDSLLHA